MTTWHQFVFNRFCLHESWGGERVSTHEVAESEILPCQLTHQNPLKFPSAKFADETLPVTVSFLCVSLGVPKKEIS